jgi:hypothetical protein
MDRPVQCNSTRGGGKKNPKTKISKIKNRDDEDIGARSRQAIDIHPKGLLYF